jgi:hypothetical protein
LFTLIIPSNVTQPIQLNVAKWTNWHKKAYSRVPGLNQYQNILLHLILVIVTPFKVYAMGQAFLPLLEHRWHWSFAITCKIINNCSWISGISWKWCPCSCGLILRNKNKSQWAKSCVEGGWRTAATF